MIKGKWEKIVCSFLTAAMLAGCGGGAAQPGSSAGGGAAQPGSSAGGGAVQSGAEPGGEGIQMIESSAGSLADGAEMTGDGFPTRIPAFTAKDLDGNTVTEDIFAEKDLTVLNIWGTFCTPCVEEMPELGEWSSSMAGNVQLVGLVCDIWGDEDTEHRELAVRITETAKADFVNIIANEDFDEIMKYVVGVPTTLFVDKEGNLVGEPIVGAYVGGYKEFVEEYLGKQ